MKNKIVSFIPWKQACWVGGYGEPIQLCEMEDDSLKKYSAVKAIAAIKRAMRK